MLELNQLPGNEAAKITHSLVEKCLTEFDGHIYAVEMGVPFGGNVESLGKILKDRGTVYGFDTFEGHPIEEIANKCPDTVRAGGEKAFAAWCMQYWYDTYGMEKTSYEYIREELDKQELFNVKLVKGVVTDQTDVSFIDHLHYAMIDMDFPLSQWDGYNLLKHKFVPGGYLCMHDMIPNGHIAGCYERYQQIVAEGLFDVMNEDQSAFLVVLKKK